jgi:predicted adenylyl cyclase CyaB
MAIEIESKAWVDNPEELRKSLREKYSYIGEYIKNDTYYTLPGKSETLRVRRQDDDCIVTFKKKSREGGIEENLETEFTVSDCEAFEQLISKTNCREYFRKRKKSEVFTWNDFTIELSHVDRLGWFIEVEKLMDNDVTDEKLKVKKEIQEIMKSLNVTEEKIESRFYSELLMGIQE